MPLESAGATDVGRKRDHNEDALLMAPEHNLWAVYDGMGGHQAGEVASALGIQTLKEFFDHCSGDVEATWPFKFNKNFDEMTNKLMVGIAFSNQRILEAGEAEVGKKNMGSTAVTVAIEGSRAYFAWLGDSRGYLWRRGEIMPVTQDHSLVNELLRKGQLTPEEAVNYAHKNVITRALGQTPKVEVDVEPRDLEDGDICLVCCDGVTGMVPDDRMAEILRKEPNLDKAAKKLVDAANAAGGVDNITVALIRYRA